MATEKKRLNKPKTWVLLSILFAATLLVGTHVYAQNQDKAKSATDLANERVSKNKFSWWENIIRRVRPQKLTEELTKEEIQDAANKAEDLSPQAQIIKRDTITRALQNINGDYLLVSENGFKVVYVPSPDAFFVYLKSPVSTNRTQAENWFTGRGFSRADLCNLGIHFVLDVENPNGRDRSTIEREISGC